MRRHLLRSRAGQALVEYAVILALIGAGLMAVLLVLRNGVGAAYEETGARLDTVACGMGRDAVCSSPAGPADGSGGGAGSGGPGGHGGTGGHGAGNGQGNHGNGNGNGGGDGSNGGGNGNGNGNNGNGDGSGNGPS
jgi:Flp pilus assembly pilin Flp